MSKWTLIRKTEATWFDRLQNLWEGCFEMKVDHCKNQGAAMFDFEKPTRILTLKIQMNKPSQHSGKRCSAHVPIV